MIIDDAPKTKGMCGRPAVRLERRFFVRIPPSNLVRKPKGKCEDQSGEIVYNYADMKQKKITQEALNRALAENGQPTIDFAKILLPGETVSNWIEEFRKANQGGYLLDDTKTGMRNNDWELVCGSSKQAVENQNIINIDDALVNGGKPKIVNPRDFQEALMRNNRKLRLTRATGTNGRSVR